MVPLDAKLTRACGARKAGRVEEAGFWPAHASGPTPRHLLPAPSLQFVPLDSNDNVQPGQIPTLYLPFPNNSRLHAQQPNHLLTCNYTLFNRYQIAEFFLFSTLRSKNLADALILIDFGCFYTSFGLA